MAENCAGVVSVDKEKVMSNYCYDTRRIYTFYHEAIDIIAGKMPRPRMALIYPSRVCNHSCYYCSDRCNNKKINAVMDKSKFLSLPEKLKNLGVESCELCGGGEPLLHPDIEEFIIKCRNKKLKLASLTNGTMLKGRLQELIVEYFSYIRVSLDTFNEVAYRIIRRPKTESASLKQVLSNLKSAIALKRKIDAPIQIGLKVCVCQDNFKNIRENVKRALDLGADSIQIKLAQNSPKSNLSKSVIIKAENELSWCKSNIRGIVILGSFKMPRIDHKCWLSPCHIFIDTSGEARICCYYQFREKTHTYGNVFREGVEKVWFGSKHKKALRNIKIEECNKWDCKYFIYNTTMKNSLINDQAQWQFV